MKQWLLFGACALFASAACADQVVERTYQFDLTLAADGSVQAMAPRGEVSPGVAEFLEQQARSWEFAPGEVEGTPVDTFTTLSIRLRAEPNAENPDMADVSVLEAQTGVSRLDGAPPRFPRELARRGTSGTVVVSVDVDADGQVEDVRPFEHAPEVDEQLQRAVIESVRSWTFTTERVDGRGVPATVVVPVCFTLQPMRSAREAVSVQTPRCEYSLTGNPEDGMQTLGVTREPVARLLSGPAQAPAQQ